MDNGSQGREKMRARDLTAEIDRVTEVGRRMNEAQRQPEAMRQDAERPGRMEQPLGFGKEILSAAGEVARDERELTQAQEFVGDESETQVRERLADDLEDARNEAGEGLGFENRIVARNQEGVARAIAPEVDRMVNQGSFRPSDLYELYRRGVNATLEIFGRRIGDRN